MSDKSMDIDTSYFDKEVDLNKLDGVTGMKRGLASTSKKSGNNKKRKQRVHWDRMLDSDCSGSHITRDAEEALGSGKKNPASNGTPYHAGREPDQPPVTDKAARLDQPNSEYETLFDNVFARCRDGINRDSAVQDQAQRQQLRLTMNDGLLWRDIDRIDRKLYVPQGGRLREDILYWHHDVPWCAHLGIGKTLELVKRQFWWPKMSEDIKAYIETCFKCQAHRPDRRNKQTPSRLWCRRMVVGAL
jgi:Integrase zinc binding domain